jgi:sugar phosphate isomerase/epimerase
MSIYAVSAGLVADLSVERALDMLVESGFQQIEVSGDDQAMDRWLSDPAYLRRRLDVRHIEPRSVHIPAKGWDNAASDPSVRQASLEASRVAMSKAAELGAEIVVCHANRPSDPFTGETYEDCFERSRASLETLSLEAQRLGVKLALENLPARGTPRPTAKMDQVLALIGGLGEHVGVCLDVGHSNANGLDPAFEAEQAGDKLFALHLQDNDGLGEDQHLLPGQGTTDWESFLAALDRMRFVGLRTFEPGKGMSVEETLSALAALADVWNRDHD